MDDMQDAPGGALLLWGLLALAFTPVGMLALGIAGADVMAGAAVRGACAAMRAARGEQ